MPSGVSPAGGEDRSESEGEDGMHNHAVEKP